MAYVEPPCPGTEPCACRGVVTYGRNALQQIGITPQALAAGTPCLIADFDGNGFNDFAFVDPTFGHPTLAARVQVLLFDEVGLKATAILPKRVRALGLAPAADGRTALVEPGLTAERYHFVYRDDRFVFEPLASKK